MEPTMHAKETALPRWAAGHGSSRTLIIQKRAALKTLPKDGLEGWPLLRLAQPAAESGSCFTLKLQAVASRCMCGTAASAPHFKNTCHTASSRHAFHTCASGLCTLHGGGGEPLRIAG